MSEELLNLLNQPVVVATPLCPTTSERKHVIYPPIYCARSVLVAIAVWLGLMLIIFPLMYASNIIATALLGVIFVSMLLGFMFSPLFMRAGKLKIAGEGLYFPLQFLNRLGGRRFRPWTDIEYIDVHYDRAVENEIPQSILSMAFKSGGNVEITLSRIPHEDLTKLTATLRTGLAQTAGFDGSTNEERDFPLISELSARSEFELSTGKDYIIVNGHRRIMNSAFGLTRVETLAHPQSFCDGRFIVQKVLAASDSRAVYRVVDYTGMPFYLHMFDLMFVKGESREQCLQELLAASLKYGHLQSHGVTGIIQGFCDEGKFCLITEVVEGKSIRQSFHSDKTMPEKSALRLIHDLAESLAPVHAAGLFVGAIRPDSVVRRGKNEVMLTEFGFVNDIIGRHTNLIIHDAAYCDLAQLQGKTSAESDLYALGALLYFLVTGQDPIPASVNRPRALKHSLSPSIDRIATLLMSANPAERGQGLDELGLVKALPVVGDDDNGVPS